MLDTDLFNLFWFDLLQTKSTLIAVCWRVWQCFTWHRDSYLKVVCVCLSFLLYIKWSLLQNRLWQKCLQIVFLLDHLKTYIVPGYLHNMLFIFFPSLAGAKAFVCDQCGAQFSKEDALEAHRQTHTGMLTFFFKHIPKKRSWSAQWHLVEQAKLSRNPGESQTEE